MGLTIAVLILFVMLQGFLPATYANIIGVTLCVSLGGVAFAMWLIEWVLSLPEGSIKAIEIATAIREGADGFLRCDPNKPLHLLALCPSLACFVGCARRPS